MEWLSEAEYQSRLTPSGWPKDWRADLWRGGMAEPNVCADFPSQIASWRREADVLWPLDQLKDKTSTAWKAAACMRYMAAQTEVLYEQLLAHAR